jgi:subtilase family serine protease
MGANVSKLEILLASVSALALMSSGAYAHMVGPSAARVRPVLTQSEIAHLPQQKDRNLEREFTVFLKPGTADSADLVQSYFRTFGFRTEYFPYTNTVRLLGSYGEAEQAGGFVYVQGRLPITPLRTSHQPNFPQAVANAILTTTFNPGPVMRPLLKPTVPTTMKKRDGVYGLAPFKSDYGVVYGYNQVYAAGYDGTGETVDIAACFGYNAGDLNAFKTDFSITPSPNVTAVTANNPLTSSIEPDLDVQRVYGTAPGAAIRMWFSQTCTLGDFTNMFTDIANDQAAHPAAAFSVSYGLSELVIADFYGTGEFTGADTALSAITGGSLQKVALFAASGDDGDMSLDDAINIGTPLGQADVLFFASDAHVLAVGGTNLVLTGTDTRKGEFAWSGSAISNLGGSGGGISNLFTIPSWQVGVKGTFSQKWKNLPDVSSVASINSPPLMVAAAYGGVIQVGGTSAASPTWAGTVALLKEAGVNSTNWPQYLYTNGKNANSYFRRIWQGANGRFFAHANYDNVTGLGVPCLLHFPSFCTKGK